MPIDLSPWEPVFPSQVYARDGSILKYETGKPPVIARRILLPRVSRMQTKEEVRAFLLERASRVNEVTAEQGSFEERFFTNFPPYFPPDFLTKFRAQEPAYLGFIENVIDRHSIDWTPNATYLIVSHGILPKVIIESNHLFSTPEGYAILFDPQLREYGLGETWEARLTLQDGSLPDSGSIYTQIQNGSPSSDVMRITYFQRGTSAQEEVKEVIEIIYQNEGKTPGSFREFRDTSQGRLERLAGTAMQYLDASIHTSVTGEAAVLRGRDTLDFLFREEEDTTPTNAPAPKNWMM